MAENRSGLQKNISAIFESAPVLNQDGSIMPSSQNDAADGSMSPQGEVKNAETPTENPGLEAVKQSVPVENPPQSQTPATMPAENLSLALKLSNTQNAGKNSTPVNQNQPFQQTTPQAKDFSKEPNEFTQTNTVAVKTRQNTWKNIKNRFFAPKPGLSTQRQIATAMLIPILAIVFIAVAIKVFGLPGTGKAEAKVTDAPKSSAAVSDEVKWQAPEPYPTDLRDPMKIYRTTEVHDTDQDNLFINGIVHSYDKPSVIIGDKIVHVGDRIGNTVITKITLNGVEFESDGKKWTQNYSAPKENTQKKETDEINE